MNNLLKINRLPLLTLVCGALGLLLRFGLYATAVDGKGLLVSGHYLLILSWVLTIIVAALLFFIVRTLDGDNGYAANFSPSILGGIGYIAAGVGLLLTVTRDIQGFAYMEKIVKVWIILGIATSLCLFALGILRTKGIRPFFGLHGLLILFLGLHLVCQYREWSGMPQSPDFTFQLFACMFMMLAAYYHAGFDVDMGQRRHLLFVGLLGSFLCCMAVVKSDAPILYLTFGFWMVTNLCPLNPPAKPRTEPEESSELPTGEEG